MRRHLRLGVPFFTLGLLLFQNNPAQAQTPVPNYRADAKGPTSSVTVNYTFNNGAGYSKTGNTNAGQFSTNVQLLNVATPTDPLGLGVAKTTVTNFASYCVDLYQTTSAGLTNASLTVESGILPYASVGASPPDRNIGAAAWLFANQTDLFDSVANPDSLTLVQQQAAMQVAIWEVTFDGVGIINGLDSGKFKINNTSGTALKVKNYAKSLLAAATVGTGTTAYYKRAIATLVNFNPPDLLGTGDKIQQDQIIRPMHAPEPGTLFASVLALGLVAALRRPRKPRV